MRRYWGTGPIGSRRTKPPISTPDAGVTGAGWSGGRGRASRRGAERSEIAKCRGRAGLATAETTRGPLHPLRGTTPVTGRDTRSEEVHCQRIGCSAPNHKNKRGICETTTDTTRRPQQREGRCTRYGARHPLRGTTPVTGRDTRYGARHPIRRGALPTDRVQRTQSQEQTRNLRDDGRHNARAAAPDQKGCTAYGSGAAHPITRTNAESARRSPTRTRPRELALPGPQHIAISQHSTSRRRGRRRR